MYTNKRYIIVLGSYRSGSSCLCGVLHELGVEFGTCIAGNFQNPKGYFEHEISRRRLTGAFDQARALPTVNDQCLLDILARWKSSLANSPAPVVGLKHPLLCLMGHLLPSIFSEHETQYLTTERPTEEIVASLQHCQWLWAYDADFQSIVRKLCESRDRFLAETPCHRVKFHHLLKAPELTISDLAKYLGLTPSHEQFHRAVAFVRPQLVGRSS